MASLGGVPFDEARGTVPDEDGRTLGERYVRGNDILRRRPLLQWIVAAGLLGYTTGCFYAYR